MRLLCAAVADFPFGLSAHCGLQVGISIGSKFRNGEPLERLVADCAVAESTTNGQLNVMDSVYTQALRDLLCKFGGKLPVCTFSEDLTDMNARSLQETRRLRFTGCC